MNKIDEIQLKDDIMFYFDNRISSSYFDSSLQKRCHTKPIYLRVLDNKYRKFYTGVTLRYITYHVLKGKYKKQYVAKALKELHLQGDIRSLYCREVNNFVFEPITSKHWNFETMNANLLSQFRIERLHIYLDQFINKKLNPKSDSHV